MTEPVVVRNWLACFAIFKSDIEARYTAGEIAAQGLLAQFICNDIEMRSGLRLSAQASPYHACSLMRRDMAQPFSIDPAIPPTDFEIMIYVDDGVIDYYLPDNFIDCTENPGGWVPASMLEDFIVKNGGWVKDQAPL